MSRAPSAVRHRSIDPGEADSRTRYELLTSLVVPRPIGWIGTRGPDDVPNLAPFSYFAAVSHTPMLLSVSIGRRRGGMKDTLRNVLHRQAFCVNLVTERHLEAMNLTSGGYGPDVDEFEVAGLQIRDSPWVDAPWVADAPAVFHCRVYRVVELGASPSTLVLGEVVGLLLDERLDYEAGTSRVDPRTLGPVGRLSGSEYTLLGQVLRLPRP
ncbi:MAG TPA: flavin reductase family protein [Longimicrobiales bacterium]|nr:flavin reductase family protein [Longimicrobiales bacterium]